VTSSPGRRTGQPGLAAIAFLTVGALIAWSTVSLAFMRFYRTEGTLLKLTNCQFPNPVTTPCFYGAIGFLIALIWAVSLARQGRAGAGGLQGLWWFLLACSIFGWSNVAIEFWRWQHGPTGFVTITCSTDPMATPFQSPCLYGSLMFLGAWIAVSARRGID
jgi:hypothetical protein